MQEVPTNKQQKVDFDGGTNPVIQKHNYSFLVKDCHNLRVFLITYLKTVLFFYKLKEMHGWHYFNLDTFKIKKSVKFLNCFLKEQSVFTSLIICSI